MNTETGHWQKSKKKDRKERWLLKKAVNNAQGNGPQWAQMNMPGQNKISSFGTDQLEWRHS